MLAVLGLASAPAAGDDGRPRIESFSINGGAAATSTLDVRLALEVSGGLDSYRASEDRRLLGADWRPYLGDVRFRLRADGGEHRTVYVQVRYKDRVSSVVSQSIRYHPPRDEYDLPLADARTLARERDWKFSLRPGNPVSACDFAGNRDEIVLTARRKRATIDGICDFVLFGGDHRLMPGWRFVRFERARDQAANCQFRFFEFPVIDGDRITFRMRIVDRAARAGADGPGADGGEGCSYRISRLVLQGPPGRQWRDAFPP